MNVEHKKAIFESVAYLANFFSGQVTDERIRAYAEYLSDYRPEDLRKAFRECLVRYKYFPTIAEILNILTPPVEKKDLANEMAGAIFQAMREFGVYQWEAAKEKLGPEAWFAVESFGGWREIGMVNTDQMQAARAQLRDMCSMAMTVKSRPVNQSLLGFQKAGNRKLGDLMKETLRIE